MCSSVAFDLEPESLTVEVSTEALVRLITERIAGGAPAESGFLFDQPAAAVEAAERAWRQLRHLSLADRGRMIDGIRSKIRENAPKLARMELEETGMGNYAHKVEKHCLTVDMTPGLEDIKPQAISGDDGLTLVEYRPFGLAGCILPSTAPSCTAVHNAICMIAAGNAAVLSPHPAGLRTTLEAVRLINEAIREAGGPEGLISCLTTGTLDNTRELIRHPKIDLLLATGGPAVVRELMSSGKKAIGAGPGNPPVLVDETADIPKAARDIIDGNSFENCLQCIGEKECFVVDCVAGLLISEMRRSGAYLIKEPEQIERLTRAVTVDGMPNKALIGKDAPVILRAIGIEAGDDIRSIIYEAPPDHITVREEFLMPLLPIVRVRDVDEGILLSVKAERRLRHSAMIHSRNIQNITKYVQAMQTTILVKNGPSYAGVGLGGEGYAALSIAGPSGEGLTSPRTFTRPQRCVMCGEFSLRGAATS